GLGDLFQRQLLAPRGRGLEMAGGLALEAGRLVAGMRQDVGGFLGRVALAPLVLGEQLLRLVAQPLRLVERRLDPGGALVERGGDHLADRLGDQHDEDDEGDEDPEFRAAEQLHQRCPPSAPSTAARTWSAGSGAPISLVTIAAALSVATLRMSASAACLAAAMPCSAVRVRSASAAMSAASRLAFSAAIASAARCRSAWAWPRASASALL